jgi:hypothetical protein
MSSPKSSARTEQVNLRLTQEEHDVLSALVFLEETSAPEALRSVVVRYLAQKADDPQVKLALRALRERRGIKSGHVTSLPQVEEEPSTGA